MDEATMSTPTPGTADADNPRNSASGMADPWRYRKVLVSPDRGFALAPCHCFIGHLAPLVVGEC